MSWRTVVVSNRAKLDLHLNHLVIRGDEIKRVLLDDISVLIIETTAASTSSFSKGHTPNPDIRWKNTALLIKTFAKSIEFYKKYAIIHLFINNNAAFRLIFCNLRFESSII
ncbi:CRISPR-associated protein Cas1, NMENI subtype [Treponema phagedenis F0421]|nr:CRISPR-associated protein Cas1, NMENI subtype [Treponema phagedenis F0421]